MVLYSDINVIATLFTSIITRIYKALKLFGEEGYIELPDFWKARSVKLFDKEFNLQDALEDNRAAHGFIFEMQHANDLILDGKIESPVIPNSRSNDIQKTRVEVRKQIGLKYPFETV